MSKETDMKQMSLLEDSPVNHFQSQGKEKEQMTTDISGMKLLESSENVNPDGLLGKMLKVLLTSKTAWYSDRCKMIWKKKVSKSGVLLFQLQAKVYGITGKECGFLPTPTVGCEEGGAQSSRVEQTKSGGFVSRSKGSGITYGSKLSDAILYMEKRYPTPTARDYKDIGYNPSWKPKQQKSIPTEVLKNNTQGGKLNPNFVECLMAYPMNWTKVEPTE